MESDFSSVTSSKDTLGAYDDFYTTLNNLIETHLPLKTSKFKPKILSKPWFTTGMKISNQHKIKLYKK